MKREIKKIYYKEMLPSFIWSTIIYALMFCLVWFGHSNTTSPQMAHLATVFWIITTIGLLRHTKFKKDVKSAFPQPEIRFKVADENLFFILGRRLYLQSSKEELQKTAHRIDNYAKQYAIECLNKCIEGDSSVSIAQNVKNKIEELKKEI